LKDVSFAFWIADRVVTPLGSEGIISMAAIDDGEKKTYYVKTATSGDWWNEPQLKKKEE
jgi:hypothetical protein